MKILVAEDDRVTRTRILAHLRDWGHDPVAAGDGEEAWEIFQQADISMIITDWQMPKLDGIGLIHRVRNRAKDGIYVYTLLLTSRSEKQDIVAGIDAGADDFVTKPFDVNELRARIHAGERILALESALDEKNRNLAAANARMTENLEAAARIQTSFLPGLIDDDSRARFAWHYQPCEELAGDTLNIVPLERGKFAIYIVDVSGHGVAAALLSVHLGRTLTRLDGPDTILLTARKKGGGPAPPSTVAAKLNQRFPYEVGVGQYFTLLCGVLDLDALTFTYTSAGHPGPIVISADQATIHEATPPGIGLVEDAEFQEQTLHLLSGDRLCLYTDGVYEIMNADGEEFGEARLAEVIRQSKVRGENLYTCLGGILESARTWGGNEPFEDDFSLLGIDIA
jgi:sigma-B regulation protein RsbU (phosphoserine phosphatase)